jgi:hypothetical protein
MVQMAVGMMGMFIVHPKESEERLPDRDFTILLHEWAIEPGTYRPDPSVMLDFNLFTFNSKVFPAIDHLVVRHNDLVRIRLGNLSMDEHPIHLHGHAFQLTGTDGGTVPLSARHPETTVLVPPGATRAVDFIADAPGDWPLHCHKTHHTMNAMGHGVPNMIGVDASESEARIRALLPGFMTMGTEGMAEHQVHSEHMDGPENTLPMMMGVGPYGRLEMGGMFTVVKVREGITSYEDPGWYDMPPGTQAKKVELPEEYRNG